MSWLRIPSPHTPRSRRPRLKSRHRPRAVPAPMLPGMRTVRSCSVEGTRSHTDGEADHAAVTDTGEVCSDSKARQDVVLHRRHHDSAYRWDVSDRDGQDQKCQYHASDDSATADPSRCGEGQPPAFHVVGEQAAGRVGRNYHGDDERPKLTPIAIMMVANGAITM